MPATREARRLVSGPASQPEALYAKLSPGPGLSAPEVADHQRVRIQGAMVELVAERGYDAVTVRELAHMAGVSTRTFYQHYSGKEACFLCTHELIVQRLLRCLALSQVGVDDWHKRVRLMFHSLVNELAADPRATHLILVEAYINGPVALKQAWRARRALRGRVGESLACAPDGIVVPPLLIEGMVAGVLSVARTRSLVGRVEELSDLGDPLLDWALSYRSEVATSLSEIDRASSLRRPETRLRPVPSSKAEGEGSGAGALAGDLAPLLSAAAKLAARDDNDRPTVRQILAAAGVPRRSFYAHFESAEDCVAAALERQIDEVVVAAKGSMTAGSGNVAAAHRAILMLFTEIAGNPALADICGNWASKAGASGILCRQRLIREVAQTLDFSTSCVGGELIGEASGGAIIGILASQVLGGHTRRSSYPAATLAYLGLAPQVGANWAMEAILEEHVIGSKSGQA